MNMVVLVMMFIAGGMAAAQAQAPGGAPEKEEALAQLRSRMELEREKESELGLLQLDVERLKLELEKKKMLAELNGDPSKAGTAAAADGPAIIIRSIFINGPHQQAVMVVDGIEHVVNAGDVVDGHKVVSIGDKGIVIRKQDGAPQFMALGM